MRLQASVSPFAGAESLPRHHLQQSVDERVRVVGQVVRNFTKVPVDHFLKCEVLALATEWWTAHEHLKHDAAERPEVGGDGDLAHRSLKHLRGYVLGLIFRRLRDRGEP